MKDEENDVKKDQNSKQNDDMFSVEEITIEEMSIDGICGVY